MLELRFKPSLMSPPPRAFSSRNLAWLQVAIAARTFAPPDKYPRRRFIVRLF